MAPTIFCFFGKRWKISNEVLWKRGKRIITPRDRVSARKTLRLHQPERCQFRKWLTEQRPDRGINVMLRLVTATESHRKKTRQSRPDGQPDKIAYAQFRENMIRDQIRKIAVSCEPRKSVSSTIKGGKLGIGNGRRVMKKKRRKWGNRTKLDKKWNWQKAGNPINATNHLLM